MASKSGPAYEQAWRDAKKICHLNGRQVKMARTLGMNPKKVPGLRPSPKERWKLPVGEFIEECYLKRFPGDSLNPPAHKPGPGSSKLSRPQRDLGTQKLVKDPKQQMIRLVCYLASLTEDLETWLVAGKIAPEVMPKVIEELRDAMQALERGDDVFPFSEIPLAPIAGHRESSRRLSLELGSDDEIPF